MTAGGILCLRSASVPAGPLCGGRCPAGARGGGLAPPQGHPQALRSPGIRFVPPLCSPPLPPFPVPTPLLPLPAESESSVVSDPVIPLALARQAPLSRGFSRQDYWSGLPFSSPWHLPYLGIEPRSPALQADSLLSETPGKAPPWWNPTNLYAPPCRSPEVNPNSPRAAACTSCVCKALLERLAGFRHLR